MAWSGAGRDYRHRRGLANDFAAYLGPFGIVTFDRRPKEALAALRALWTGGRAGPERIAGVSSRHAAPMYHPGFSVDEPKEL